MYTAIDLAALDRTPPQFAATRLSKGARTAALLVECLLSQPRVWTLAELVQHAGSDNELHGQRVLNTLHLEGLILPAGRGYVASDKFHFMALDCRKWLGKQIQDHQRHIALRFYDIGDPVPVGQVSVPAADEPPSPEEPTSGAPDA